MGKGAFFLLVLCNAAWAANPLMGKWLVNHFSGLQVAWIRYAGAAVTFWGAAIGAVFFFKKNWSDFFFIPKDRIALMDLAILGLGPFVFSPILQFKGLESALASENSILVATEPLITLLMARLILGEKMNRGQWVSIGISLLGFFVFSGLWRGVALSLGLLYLLFAQLGECSYSVFCRKLVRYHPPTAVLGSALTLGALVLSGLVIVLDPIVTLPSTTSETLLALLWLGPVGSTAAYLVWALIARKVEVPAMALTLFLQPVVGVLLGIGILGERLTPDRTWGGGLILLAMAYLLWSENRSSIKN